MVRSSGVRIARHHAACRTVDTKPRRGILADDPVSDRFGRRRWLRPLRGCGKGGAVEFLGEVPFVRTERWGIGGFRYHWLCSMFRTLSQPLPVPENGTFSLSRAQSRTCSGYAEARKRREKTNVFVKPSAEPNLFRLCRGERTKNEIQPELPIAYEVERSRKKETERCANTAPSGRLTPATYLSKY